jgi:Fibronectin type III domain
MTTRSCSGSPHRWRFPLAAAALTACLAACGQVSPADTRSTAASIPPAPGTANLTWTPVTQNTDGTPATDLAGYQIRYGTSPAALDTTIVEADPTQTSYVVTNLTPGTWYFAVAAYTNDGTPGVMSNLASKTID